MSLLSLVSFVLIFVVHIFFIIIILIDKPRIFYSCYRPRKLEDNPTIDIVFEQNLKGPLKISA